MLQFHQVRSEGSAFLFELNIELIYIDFSLTYEVCVARPSELCQRDGRRQGISGGAGGLGVVLMPLAAGAHRLVSGLM